jgi:two-component system NtrC family sensor kinase
MPSQPATLLCVDDDSQILDMLDRIFAKHPFTMLHATDSQSTLQMVHDRSDIDLLLLDIMLPGGIDGLEICRRIRADRSRPYLPIIMLTALGQTDQIAMGLDTGADDYIVKPFSPREIVARVEAILRLRRAQHELIEAQNRYRVLVETSRDVIFALSTAGQLTYISPACQTLSGCTVDELLADPTPLARIIHPDDRSAVDLYFQRAQANTDQAEIEFRIVRQDTEIRWVTMFCTAIRAEAGQPIGLQGNLRDITPRKQNEAAIRQRAQELAALNLIATRANQSLELENILSDALDAMMEVLGIEYGAIYLRQDNDFKLRAARGLSPETAAQWPQIVGALDAERSAEPLQPIVLRADEAAQLELISAPDQPLGIRAGISVPLQQRGTFNGLLTLASRDAHKFDQSESTLINTVAEEIGVAITNARLYEETRQRVEELGLLNEVNRMLSSTLDLDKVLRVIMEVTASLLQGEAGSVLLLDHATGDLVFAASVGPKAAQILGMHVPANTGIAQRALREGHAISVTDVRQDESFFDGIDDITGLTTRRLIAAPLRTHGRVIGVMEIVNKRRDLFSDSDLRLVDLLAPFAAAAIENARLHARDTQLTAEVRRHNQELQALHALSAALSQSLELTHVLDVSLVMMQPLLEFAEGSIALLADGVLTHAASYPAAREAATLRADRAELADRISHAAIEARTVKIVDRSALAADQAVGALVAVPLWGHDHVQGVLQMIWETPREFSAETAPLLVAMGQQIGVAIERAHLYEVAQRRAKEIEQSYARLLQSEKLAATGRLAMSLAHEINNPLQAVQNCLHLALESNLGEEQKINYLKLAREEVERLSLLVQRMLDFYRPSPDAQNVADIQNVMERVLALSAQKLRLNEIDLHVAETAGKLLVQIEPDQLAQVFLNLIVNAAEAMENGGQLRIASSVTDDWIETRISDSGPGIPADLQLHIFEPFYTTKPDGTGLGLAISYTIIERSGGSISVDSQPGEGTTFIVKLPKASGVVK